MADTSKIYPRDSSIIFTFTNLVAPSCAEKIQLRISSLEESKNALEYFKEPVLNENQLALYANIVTGGEDEFIPVAKGGEKAITVVLSAADFYYTNTDYNEPQSIPLASDFSCTYTINSETAEKTKILAMVGNEEAGTFRVDGISADNKTLEYSIGKTISLSYKVSDDYYLAGWKFDHTYTDASGSEQTETIEDMAELYKINLSITYEEEDFSQAVITVNNHTDGLITITPVTQQIPVIPVKIDGTHGKFSPAKNTYNVILGRTVTISFEPDSDYEFIRWQIYDEKTDNEIPNGTYIQFENPLETAANYKLISVPLEENVKLAIRPVVVLRPQVVSYSPMTSGILKDSSIQVLFDRSMDLSSIYFTQDEIDEIGLENLLPPVLVNGEEKYYGYKKNDAVSFKNISIVNNKTGENIADYFTSPIFENNNKTLSVSTKSKTEKPLDDYTQVLVTIEKDFFYSEKIDEIKTKPVTMPGIKMWMYQVNNSFDEAPLVIQKKSGKELFELKLNKNTGTAITSDSTPPAIETNGNGVETLNYARNIQNVVTNQTSSNIYLEFQLQDVAGGSGPSSYFNVYYERVKEIDYKTEASGDDLTGYFSVAYTDTTSEDAIYKGDMELKIPEDGIYRIWFDFSDRSGNHFIYPENADEEGSTIGFYVTKDTTPTSEVSQTKIESGSGDTEYIVSWESPKDLDYKETVVTLTGTSENSITVPKGTTQANINGIEAGNIYDITVSCIDYAGTKSKGVKIGTFLTGLTVEGTPSFSFLDDLFKTEETASSHGLTATAVYSDGSTKLVSEETKVGAPQNIKKPAGFYYKEDLVTKNAQLAGEYYIAKNDVLHTILSVSDTVGGSATYGNYPQSASKLSGENSYTSEYVYKEWYLGKDGYFYAKNGENYFKVEPVHWKVLKSEHVATYKQEYLLLATSILEGGIPYYVNQNDRGSTRPDDYYYSTVRAFLRGKYESGDTQEKTYEGKGFLQTAFTEKEQERIWDISILTRDDFCNSAYGFDSDGTAQNRARGFGGTAWACSRGQLKGYVSQGSGPTYWDNNHYSWTQTGYYTHKQMSVLGPNGAFGKTYYRTGGSSFSYYYEYVDATNIGILPAIKVYGNAAY